MRPQDKWNMANGYISKSYKVNQELAQNFTKACQVAGVSQAGALSNFMKSFCRDTERSRKCMQLEFKYNSDSREYSKSVEMKVVSAIENISEAEIQAEKSHFLSNLKTGRKVSNSIPALKTFYTRDDLSQYLLSDASDIVHYFKRLIVSEIALYQLMVEGSVMPIGLRNSQYMEVNIEHSHGNSILCVSLDLMPFESYMVIAPTQA